MCVGLLGLAVFFNAKNWDADLKNFQWVPVVCLCLFSIGFSAGLGSVPFVLVGELFSLSAKRIAAPLAQTTNFFLSFVVTLTFPIVAEYVGMFVLFYIFSLCCFIGVLYTWFVVPETKGKSLNEIQAKLNK
jgi:SP family facilitated glucose transporter-like MFS transporter 8